MSNKKDKRTHFIARTNLGALISLSSRMAGVTLDESVRKYTVNTLYQVNPDIIPPITNMPKIAYFGIGVNGFYNINDTNGLQARTPSRNNMNLYSQVPFRCVPIDEDLNSVERDKYRIRVRQTINGVDYFCYYLKKIMFDKLVITKTDPKTGEELPYQFDPSYLNPVPATPTDTGIVKPQGKDINVYAIGKLPVSGEELLESVNVIYGDPTRAMLSEIGIYAGTDMEVQGKDGEGKTIKYTDSVLTYLESHLCCQPISFLNHTSTDTFNIKIGNGMVDFV